MVEMGSHWSRRGSEIVLPVCVCGGSCGLSGLHAAVQGGAEARGRPRDGDVWGWSATQLAAPLCWHAVGRRTGHLSGCHGRRQRAAWASASWWVPSSVSVHKQGGFYPRARVLAKALCLCLTVCLSQVGVVLKWLDASSWFLAWRLLSTSPTLCFKETRVSTRIRVLPSGTFSYAPDLENFAMA